MCLQGLLWCFSFHSSLLCSPLCPSPDWQSARYKLNYRLKLSLLRSKGVEWFKLLPGRCLSLEIVELTNSVFLHLFYSSLAHSLVLRWGTTDDYVTIPIHLFLFQLPYSSSLIYLYPLFHTFFPHFLLSTSSSVPYAVLCRITFAKPGGL